VSLKWNLVVENFWRLFNPYWLEKNAQSFKLEIVLYSQIAMKKIAMNYQSLKYSFVKGCRKKEGGGWSLLEILRLYIFISNFIFFFAYSKLQFSLNCKQLEGANEMENIDFVGRYFMEWEQIGIKWGLYLKFCW